MDAGLTVPTTLQQEMATCCVESHKMAVPSPFTWLATRADCGPLPWYVGFGPLQGPLGVSASVDEWQAKISYECSFDKIAGRVSARHR